MESRPRSLLGVLTAVSVALLLPAIASAKGGELDLGDAPDGAPTGYSGGSAAGSFPSEIASRGARHSGLPGLTLGARVDGEADSEQVDADRHDDGAEATLKSCSDRSTLEVVLNGERLPEAQLAPGNIVYVNAWFDWNRDGDWDDPAGSCAPEWAIENLAIPAESLGADGVRLVPIGFMAGQRPKELWWRVTVTLNEPAIDPGGRGRLTPYSLGETEDYLTQRAGGGGGGGPARFTARCVPNPAVIAHGGSAKVDFLFFGGGRKKPVHGKLLSDKEGKGFGITLHPTPNQQGVPPGSTRMGSFSFKSTEVDGPQREEVFSVIFAFNRGAARRVVRCVIVVVHEGGGRGDPPGGKIPKVPCRERCGGKVPPLRPEIEGLDAYLRTLISGDSRVDLRGGGPLPLGGLSFPLGPPNPVPLDAPRLVGSSVAATCTTQALSEGPPVFDCRFPAQAPPLDSFFDVFYSVSLDGIGLRGEALDAGGTPVGSFQTVPGPPPPPPPPVTGQAALSSTMQPNAAGFTVQFNTALDQAFLLVFPSPFTVQGATSPPGFNCHPAPFEMQANAALACDGNVAANTPYQGQVQLSQNVPPNLGQNTRLYGAGSGQLNGPFPVTGPGP